MLALFGSIRHRLNHTHILDFLHGEVLNKMGRHMLEQQKIRRPMSLELGA
jgi:hypothetical protein